MSPARSLGLVFGAVVLSACGASEPFDIARSREPIRVCAAGPTVPGVDVSVWQGAIDWGRVASSGILFGIARISDGVAHRDARFAENWAGLRASGLVRGAYQYFEPGVDAALQADLVVESVGRLGAGDLPVTIDVETDGGRTAGEIARAMDTWLRRVEAGTGKAPMIYTARWFWDGSVTSDAFAGSDLWVANWDVACPDLPSVWNRWAFFQHSNHETVPGIDVRVDGDVFDGDLAALRRFAGLDAADASGNPGALPADAGDPEDVDRRGDTSVVMDAAVPDATRPYGDDPTPDARSGGDSAAAPPDPAARNERGSASDACGSPAPSGCGCRTAPRTPRESRVALAVGFSFLALGRRRSRRMR